jgi:SAM-dependent methyltransferase
MAFGRIGVTAFMATVLMPDLDTRLHLTMLDNGRGKTPIYGLHWGDPETAPHLRWVRDNYCLNFVDPTRTCIEIGPGGGRWTRYLLGFKTLYAVDYHQELLDELAKNFARPNIIPVRNSGSDFPAIPDQSVDFVFSFGVFVHLDLPIVTAYLAEISRVLKPGGRAVIQYSDKTKPVAAANPGFSELRPPIVRQAVLDRGFFIENENLTVLPHSSIIQFSRSTPDLVGSQVIST